VTPELAVPVLVTPEVVIPELMNVNSWLQHDSRTQGERIPAQARIREIGAVRIKAVKASRCTSGRAA
jgi:hypothetical protein